MRSTRIELILDTLKAVRGAKDFSKATDDVAGSLDDTARAGGKAAKAIDDAGGQMSDAGRSAALLDHEIEKLTGSLRELAIAEALTGENFSKQMKEQEAAVARLSHNRKLLGDIGGPSGEEAAVGFATKFSQKLGPELAKLPMTGLLSVPVVAAGISAVPLLAAAISGAIIGGAGIGGVAGGFAVAAQDDRVQAAIETLGGRIETRLQRAAAGFVQPALKGVHEIQQTLDDINLEQIFKDSEKFVDPLVTSVGSLITDLGDGIESLVANAGPSISVIATGITEIGHSLGDGLSGIAQNGDAAAAGLSTLLGVTNSAVQTTFMLVNALTELYGISQAIGGDMVLQTLLKLTGAEMDNTGFSAHTAGAETKDMGEQMQIAADAAAELKKQQAELKVYTDAVKAAQDNLKVSLDALGGSTSQQSQFASGLATAMDNLYGAAIRNTDANEAYQASFDSLSETVKGNADQFKHNRDNLDLHTKAGRDNRDALEALLTSSNELYISDINAGVATDAATKKHQNRTAAVKEEARRLGLNKTETQKLITTYGQIPGKKTTDLVLDGVREIVGALRNLYIYQRALATGKSISSVEDTMRKGSDAGPSKAGGGFAAGGQIGGWSPHSRADNIPAWLTAKEWVHPVDAVDYYGPQIMSAIQKRQVPREVLTEFATGKLGKMGDLPFFARGGQVAPVDTSRVWRFPTDVSGTRIPSKKEVASKIPGGSGAAFVRAQNGKPYVWAAAGPGGYDCSGIVSAVYNVLHGRNPYSHTFSTGSLPGRWFTKPGVGGPLTAAWSNPGQSPASSTTGHMMGMVGGLTFESSGSRGVHLGASTRRLSDFAHIAHYARGGHVAMANGGMLREPVFGYGMRSGNTYSLAERGPERVLSAGQTAAAAAPQIDYRRLARTLSSELRGLRVVLDGRTVGQMQGRQVDLYSRTGS